jgi:hypothetical protein
VIFGFFVKVLKLPQVDFEARAVVHHKYCNRFIVDFVDHQLDFTLFGISVRVADQVHQNLLESIEIVENYLVFQFVQNHYFCQFLFNMQLLDFNNFSDCIIHEETFLTDFQ